MKKRVLATMLTVCLLFSVFTCFASAAGDEIIIADIISSKRICPGDVIDDFFIEAPEILSGPVYAEGWEIQTKDGTWIPYDGSQIDEKAGTFKIRYFAVDYSGEVFGYSNECVVTAKHNPSGPYESDNSYHWRTCADCGGVADKAGHDHLSEDATAGNKVCTVCGHVRTSSLTGILVFLEWIMALIGSLLG